MAASPPRRRFIAGSHNPSSIPTAGESNLVANADVRPPSLSYSARPPPSSSCSRGPPPATQVLSMEVKHKKKPSTNKFTSSVVAMVVKSPGVRMMLSPTIRSPSAAIKRSPTLTPMRLNCNRKHPNSSAACD